MLRRVTREAVRGFGLRALGVVLLGVTGTLLSALPIAAQPCGICGDVNGDGDVNIVDALFIAQHTVGLRTDLPCPDQANVRATGAADIVDALFIAQFTVNFRPILCFQVKSPAALSLFGASPVHVNGLLTGQAGVTCNGTPASIDQGRFDATIPLREGNTLISCVAQDDAGNVATTTETVTLDTTPPRVFVGLPADGATVNSTPVVVSGLVKRHRRGTVNDAQAQVTCNGIDAPVSNRTFAAANVPLNPGANTITCHATDQAGNTGTADVTVTLDTSRRARINMYPAICKAG